MAYQKDPRMITLKYDAVCAETGKAMKAGEQAVYYPTGEARKNLYHPESEQAAEFRRWKADLAMGNDY